jgi:urea carboxylase
MHGPHGAPDFFTAEDIEVFFSTDWKVHYNSDRTGVRLIGPKPVWAREDGGEAGLHPSNVHDTAYAIGTVDFTGDMPVILGPDGPSLGGFVCPATIVHSELWKIGQLRPGDLVRFRAVSKEDPVLRRNDEVTYRADGDRYLLVEYGPMVLDLDLRIRVYALETELRAARLAGIIDITAGVRSLQIHYDTERLRREELLAALEDCERRIPDLADMVAPSRIVHLPLSWDDPATQLAIHKYMQSVRADAPWCPSNIEFIRRINGLASSEDVKRIVFDANYLVLGLGDVYLGAPVATPTDPRHRLVTTKYNPARTWTPENAVGIGGAYMCVYGMEGPGGYQFVGRTVQMWDTYSKATPWLLRNFDQIRFYPVSAEDLLEMREARHSPRIEDAQFRLKEYHAFLASIDFEISKCQSRQRQAFLQERERWGAEAFAEPPDAPSTAVDEAVPEGCRAVSSPVAASVWSIVAEPGQRVEAGQRLMVLEAMKMEIAVMAPMAGVLEKLHCSTGTLVSAGQRLATIRI